MTYQKYLNTIRIHEFDYYLFKFYINITSYKYEI